VSPTATAPAPTRATDAPALQALVAGMRRVVGGDHAAVVPCAAAGGFAAATHDGLPATVVAALRDAEGDEETLAVLHREFGAVVSADVLLDGEPLGTAYVVKRPEGPFDHPELLPVFAAQAALAIGLARRPPGAEAPPTLIAELSELVLRFDDVGDLSSALLKTLGPLFGGARIGLMVADPLSSTLQQVPGSFGAEGEVAASHRVSAFDLYSNSARVFTTGQPYLSNACPDDRGIRQGYVDAFGLRRLLSVPLARVGVLHIADKATPFTLADAEVALALAPRIANVVVLATTLLRQRRQQRLEEVLADVAMSVASGSASSEFVLPALEQLCSATDANLLAVVPEHGPPVVARRGTVHPDRELTVLDEADSEPGMRAYVVGAERPGDPGWAAFYVPIRLGHQRVGTLAALRNRGEPFAQGERRSLVRMANLAALARASERYQHQRAELARAHERQRIADDLHDDVAQILFAAQLSLDAILQQEGSLGDDVVAAIKRSRGLLIRGDSAIRTVINRLSAPPVVDLGARLAAAIMSVEEEFSLPVHLQVEESAVAAAEPLPPSVTEALVRVARESLVNAAKHAGPCRVVLALQLDGRGGLVLRVADDGRGIADTEDRGHGLGALRRLVADVGGTLERGHSAGGGTKVTATVPLAQAR
jgi:signal transduction histidine kinase